MLGAIMEPEWDYRYYSFNSRWAPDQAMGSMRNGSGDHWFALFLKHGTGIVGLDHEAPMFRPDNPWPGLFTGLPIELAELRAEPAFGTGNCTFCAWRLASDSGWSRGPIEYPPGDDPDGSAGLLSLLDGDPRSYVAFAADYFEREVPLEAVRAVYAHEPLSSDIAKVLNPLINLAEIEGDVAEIGYPRAAG